MAWMFDPEFSKILNNYLDNFEKYEKTKIMDTREKTSVGETYKGFHIFAAPFYTLSELTLSLAPMLGSMMGPTGYVGLPKGHKFFEKDYDELPDSLEVHGGFTYSDYCLPWVDSDNKDFWYIGFDTSHAYSGQWTLDDVLAELRQVVDQLEKE